MSIIKYIPLISIFLIIYISDMNYSDAFTRMRLISNECYIHPRGAETKMRNCFNATIKYQNKLWTKIVLERLVNKNVGTNEVVQFAKNQAKNSVLKKMHVFESVIKQNMNIKLTDAKESEIKARNEMVKRKIELKQLLRKIHWLDRNSKI